MDWHLASSALDGFIEAPEGYLENGPAAARAVKPEVRGELSVSVRSLKSVDAKGQPFSDKIDAVIQAALGAGKSPNATFRIAELSRLRSEAANGANWFEASGELWVAGEHGAVSIPVEIRTLTNGRLRVRGSTQFKLSEIGFAPSLPAFLGGGPLKSDGTATISFEWVSQPQAAGSKPSRPPPATQSHSGH